MLEGQDKEVEEGKWHWAASSCGPPLPSLLLGAAPCPRAESIRALSGQALQLFGSVWKFHVCLLPSCRAQCCVKHLTGETHTLDFIFFLLSLPYFLPHLLSFLPDNTSNAAKLLSLFRLGKGKTETRCGISMCLFF